MAVAAVGADAVVAADAVADAVADVAADAVADVAADAADAAAAGVCRGVDATRGANRRFDGVTDANCQGRIDQYRSGPLYMAC